MKSIAPPRITKPTVARSVHANRGLEIRYQKQIMSLIRELEEDTGLIVSAYRNSPPLLITMDASPVVSMRKLLSDLGTRWIKRFDRAAPKIAAAYLKGQFKATDSAMQQALKDAGWAIKFEMTPAVKEAFEASLAENVGLIRSIPQEYLKQVEGVVMRSYTVGRDLHTMVKDLRKLYPAAANRAILISRDQSNKANAVVTRARQLELGIVEAIWMHSHAGKVPRPTHLAMNGRRYKVAEGMYDPAVDRFVFPGELINCRCTGRSVLPFQLANNS